MVRNLKLSEAIGFALMFAELSGIDELTTN